MRLATVMRLVAAVAMWCALGGVARGDDERENRARGHFEIGLGLYRLGDYHGALKEFAAGYELSPKPGFLINLGQTHRKLGQLAQARDRYKQFLAEAPPHDPQRAQAAKVLAELEQTLKAQPPPAPEPPPGAVPPAPPVAPPPTTGAPAAVVERAAPPPRKPKKALLASGFVLAIAGVGLVGGGIGTSVLASRAVDDLVKLDQSGGVYDPAKDDAYRLDRTLSGVFFGIGGALAATGVVLVVVASR